MIYLLYPRMFLSSGDPVMAAGLICISGKSAFSLRDGTGSLSKSQTPDGAGDGRHPGV